jgi:hypothetical protein
VVKNAIALSALLLICPEISRAQLNENCTVSILNRSTRARSNGSWEIPNVPSGFGLVKARATCVEGGVTRSGESVGFVLQPNRMNAFPPILLGPTTPIPVSVVVSSPLPQLNSQNRTAQLTVTGRYSDNSTRNLTSSSAGTTYTISNRAIATITPDGLVTGVASGTVVVQAVHEGRQGLVLLQVILSGDSDGDGIPDDVELREGMNPNDATDGLADLDSDGLSNRRELMEFGTNVRNRDTDGDGLNDGLEVRAGTNPRDASSLRYAAVTAQIEVTPGNFALMVNVLNPLVFTQSAERATSYASKNLYVYHFSGIDGRMNGSTSTFPCGLLSRRRGLG